jgi:hypothetical protein
LWLTRATTATLAQEASGQGHQALQPRRRKARPRPGRRPNLSGYRQPVDLRERPSPGRDGPAGRLRPGNGRPSSTWPFRSSLASSSSSELRRDRF